MKLEEIQVGRNYSFKRITGRIIRCLVLQVGRESTQLVYKEHGDETGPAGIYRLTADELASFKEIDPEPDAGKEV